MVFMSLTDFFCTNGSSMCSDLFPFPA